MIAGNASRAIEHRTAFLRPSFRRPRPRWAATLGRRCCRTLTDTCGDRHSSRVLDVPSPKDFWNEAGDKDDHERRPVEIPADGDDSGHVECTDKRLQPSRP